MLQTSQMDALLAANPTAPLPKELLSLGQLMANLVIIYLASKTGAELAFRLQQPTILGELAVGLVVGVSGFHWIDPEQPVLGLLAQLGILLLLFEIGLESDLNSLLRVGSQALTVALVGMATPFGLGYLVMKWLGHTDIVSIFVGASMTMTSMGFTAKVLRDLGYLNRTEGKIVLGAAIVDDILSVVILSIVSGLAGGAGLNALNLLRIVVTSIGFLVGAIVVGNWVVPFFIRLVNVLRTRGSLLTGALICAFSLAYFAEQLSSAAIIGAFVAGLVLASTNKGHEVEEQLHPVTDFFLPVFFILVGAKVNLALLGNQEALVLSFGLTLAAFIGKAVCGYAAFSTQANRLAIGMGMVARGEIGLVFASVGSSAGILTEPVQVAVVLMVIFTTFVGPLLLSFLLKS